MPINLDSITHLSVNQIIMNEFYLIIRALQRDLFPYDMVLFSISFHSQLCQTQTVPHTALAFGSGFILSVSFKNISAQGTYNTNTHQVCTITEIFEYVKQILFLSQYFPNFCRKSQKKFATNVSFLATNILSIFVAKIFLGFAFYICRYKKKFAAFFFRLLPKIGKIWYKN